MAWFNNKKHFLHLFSERLKEKMWKMQLWILLIGLIVLSKAAEEEIKRNSTLDSARNGKG